MLKQNTIFNKKYTVLEELGAGLTANVYKIECNKTKEVFALKVIKERYLQMRPVHTAEVMREIKISKILNHKNIVHLIDSGTKGSTDCGQTNLIYMIMEYIPNAELFDLVKKCGRLGEDAARFFLRQFLSALEYMHEKKGVVHRDLKMENILITEDLTIKFADFGFATQYNIDQLVSHRGTKTYMAPEMKLGRAYHGKQVDIFSMGVIVFILAQGIYPFNEALSTDPYYKMILNGNLEQYWKTVQGEKLSPAFRDFIMKFFTFKGVDRITLEEIKAHPWFTQESISDNRIMRKIVQRYQLNDGEVGKFKIPQEQEEEPKKEVGLERNSKRLGGVIKFFTESKKQEGDSVSFSSSQETLAQSTESRLIEIEIEVVDSEIQRDESIQFIETEKYQYDRKLRKCTKKNNSSGTKRSLKSNILKKGQSLVKPISKVYNYLTLRS